MLRKAKWILLIMGLLLFVPWTTTSCVNEEEWLTEEVTLTFSTDTVWFDTVFTTIGTTTQQLKIYNPTDQPLRISSVTLRQGRLSRFRLNVDGDTSMVAKNLELGANDSIFLFVQANINPNSLTEPFLVEDEIDIMCNGKLQSIPLIAYGRNAVYHMAKPGHWTSVIDCDNWDHSLPHVIIGYAAVDSLCTLHLTAGDRIYFAPDAILYIYNGGTLDARGTPEQPVLFTSMRHDGWYDTLPGQWDYIWLSTGSRNNVMDWTIVENGSWGVVADTNVNSNPTLTITNSRIRNHSINGLMGQGSYIEGDNLLVTNCGSATLTLQYGGRYRFRNSTFADYWPYSANRRKNPSVILNNYYFYNDIEYPRPLKLVEFDNCIICGNYNYHSDTTGEILLHIDPTVECNLRFNNCLVRSSLVDAYAHDCLLNQNPVFDTAKGMQYHPGAGSPCIGAGNASYVSLPYDLDNQPRMTPPCIGAFERKE